MQFGNEVSTTSR